VVVAVVLVDGTDCTVVVEVVPTEGEVMVAAQATPAPKRSAHPAISIARASVKAS
jgi:hypothetical protein